ncbi:MAG: Gfo/Idh/MocA family oxidoreductase [Limnochordales bacterium]|nr:Gfo/Idh/MocA family oxidoreductase [Limnochordales bacterium]
MVAEETDSQLLRFGIIGCGRIAPYHVNALLRVPNVQIVAVADVVEAKARRLAEEIAETAARMAGEVPPVAVYTDYRQLLERTDIDAVSICTPSGLHPQIGIAAACAGKHVLVEKPMSLTLAGADRLIAAARENDVKLGVCFQNRFNPTVVRLRQAKENGRFGRLSHGVASVRWHRSPQYYAGDAWRGTWALDGGVLMNQAIHAIDLLQWMMGPVVRVSAFAATRYRPIEAEDVAIATLQFADGSLGCIEGATTIEPGDLEERLSIFGERGSVVIGGVALNRMETWRFIGMDPAEEAEVQAQTAAAIKNVYGMGHQPLVADFCEAVRTGREPAVDGVEGRKAVELVLAVYRSVEKGEPVILPLQEEVEAIVQAQQALGLSV